MNHQLFLGLRITERNWITAAYAPSGDLERAGYGTGHIERFHDVSVAASHLVCSHEICGAAGLGLGYQDVALVFYDDGTFHENASDLYGQLRVALRLAYKHVWFEAAIDVHVRVLDRYEYLERSGAALGVAAYVVL